MSDEKKPSFEELLGSPDKGGRRDGSYPVLNPKQQKFVEAYMKSGNAVRSAEESGFAPTYAKDLMKTPAVSKALDEARKESALAAAYNADAFMKECDTAILFAQQTENANAYAKLIELKAKHMGFLIDRLDVRQQTQFAINVFGIKNDEPKD